jgi:hypothetical protein
MQVLSMVTDGGLSASLNVWFGAFVSVEVQ